MEGVNNGAASEGQIPTAVVGNTSFTAGKELGNGVQNSAAAATLDGATLENSTVEAATIPQLPTERVDTPGLGDNQDGENVAGEQEAVCATHGKKRRTGYMSLQEDGTYTCIAPNLCKLPRQGQPGGTTGSQNVVLANNGAGGFPMQNVVAPTLGHGPQAPHMLVPLQQGPGRALPAGVVPSVGPGMLPPPGVSLGDQSVMCVVHGKYRSARNMIRSESGEYRCQPTYQCRMERGGVQQGPGRKSPLLGPNGQPMLQTSGSSTGLLQAPLMPRNTSSNMSLGSNLSIDELNRLTAMGAMSMGHQQQPVDGSQMAYMVQQQQQPGGLNPLQPQQPHMGLQPQYVVLQSSASSSSLGPAAPVQFGHPGLMPSGSSSSLLQAPVTFMAQASPPGTHQQHPGMPRNQSSGGFVQQAPQGQFAPQLVQQQQPGTPQQLQMPPQQPHVMMQPQMMMQQPHQMGAMVPPQQVGQPQMGAMMPPQQVGQPQMGTMMSPQQVGQPQMGAMMPPTGAPAQQYVQLVAQQQQPPVLQ